MNKIPVGATIAHAYRFGVTNFFRVLGTVWLCWVILTAAGILLMKKAVPLLGAMPARDFSAFLRLLPILLPFYLLIFLLFGMQLTGIMELALGTKKGSPYYYFNLGKPYWRVIGAMLAMFAILFASWLVATLAGVLLGMAMGFAGVLVAGGAHGSLLASLTVALTMAILFGFYLLVMIRFGFFLVPAAIAEEKVTPVRSWQLSKGNFWRLLAVLIAVVAPFAVVELTFVLQTLFAGMPQLPPHPTADQLAVFQAQATAWNQANAARLAKNWYIFDPLFFAFSVLLLGVSAGAQSYAYRVVSAAPPGPWHPPA